MKTKIAQAKQFAYDHRGKIIGAVTLVAGVTIGKNLPTEKAHFLLNITTDQAKQLIDNPSAHAHFDTAVADILVYVNPA